MQPSASIIIPIHNGASFLERCLAALAAQQGVHCTIVAVDNASSDGSAALVAALAPHALLLRNQRNLGFSVACNQGLRAALAAGAEVCVLLNQDTEVAPDWLAALLAAFGREPRVGAVGCKIFGADGLLQHVGGRLAFPRAVASLVGLGEADHGQYDAPSAPDYLHGAALALRSDALRQVGLLDERFSPAYMEEVDLCFRLRAAGWQVRYEPTAWLHHFEHGSPLTIIPRLRLLHRNRLRFVFKHCSAADILERFWPAERRALASLVGTFDEPALRRAYLDALLQFDTFLAARADVGQLPFNQMQRREAALMLRELRDDFTRLGTLVDH